MDQSKPQKAQAELDALKQAEGLSGRYPDIHKDSAACADSDGDPAVRLLDCLPDSVIVFAASSEGAAGDFLDANEAACRALGYSRDELLAMSITDVCAPGMWSDLPPVVRRLFQKGELLFPMILIRGDGKRIPVEMNCRLLQMKEGHAVIAAARDMSDRRLLEEELNNKTLQLNLRIKELNCLFSIADLVSKPGLPLREICEGVVRLVPSGMRFPEKVAARLVVDRIEFKSENLVESLWKQSFPIVASEETVGALEAHFLELFKDFDNGPLLSEEIGLLRTVAERLGKIVERHRLLAELEHNRMECERELSRIESLGGPAAAPVAAQAFGLAPLSEALPDQFEDMVIRYERLMDSVLEERVYKVDHRVSDELRNIAERLGFLRAGPRDVTELHSAAVKRKIRLAPRPKARAYMEEARLMAFQLMGFLAGFYKRQSAAMWRGTLQERRLNGGPEDQDNE